MKFSGPKTMLGVQELNNRYQERKISIIKESDRNEIEKDLTSPKLPGRYKQSPYGQPQCQWPPRIAIVSIAHVLRIVFLDSNEYGCARRDSRKTGIRSVNSGGLNALVYHGR